MARRKIAGLPIGPRQPRFPLARAARVGAVGVTALSAIPAAQRTIRSLGHGAELASKAGDAIGAAGEIKDSVASHSTTVGKAAGLVGGLNRLRKGNGSGKPKLAHLIEEHTDISVPRSVAYNQWTQLEMLPAIVKGVATVDQLSDDRSEWSSKIGPVQRRWKAKVTEQVPDERIVWKSEGGPHHEGVVTFHSLDEDLTRVMIEMHYQPHGPFEVVANKLRVQRRRVRRDLRLFKHYLELRGEETGGWRGQIGPQDKGKADGTGSGGESGRRGGSGRSRSRTGSSGTRAGTSSSRNGSGGGRSSSGGRRSSSAGRATNSTQNSAGTRNGAVRTRRPARKEAAR